MPNEWKQARMQIKAFKNYYDSLPQVSKTVAARSYVITKEQIEALMGQHGNGSTLNGLRIYIGLDNTGGQHFPVLHIVASQLVNSSFDDFGIPDSGLDLETDPENTIIASMPLKAGLFPCPTTCGKQNVLNR